MRKRRVQSIKFKIVGMISFLIIMSTIILTVISNYYGKRSVDDIATKLIDKTSDLLLHESFGYLSKVDRSIIQIKSTLDLGLFFSIKNKGQLIDFFEGFLGANNEYSGVYYGSKNGDFYMSKRLEDNSLSQRMILRDDLNAVESWVNPPDYGASGTFPSSDIYDPRVRPWYINAQNSKNIVWSDSYRFASDNQLGITRSFPVIDNQGYILGVVGIDIKLNRLFDFIRTIIPTVNSRISIIDRPSGKILIDTDDNEDKSIIYTLYGSKHIDPDKDHIKYKGESYFVSYNSFKNIPWDLQIVIPEDDFLKSIKENNRAAFLFTFIILIFTVIVGVVISGEISTPLNEVARRMNTVRNFDLTGNDKIETTIREINTISDSLENMRIGLISFQKYVPSELVRDLIKLNKVARVGGEKRILTTLFTDIENFSIISEQTLPEDLVKDLSEYLSLLGGVIMDKQGIIDKFMGDAIMAFWGAPNYMDNHAFLACQAAIVCKRREMELMDKWKNLGKSLFISRIGINTGELIVGNMGSEKRLSYSVIGDSVNLAARLEAINKEYGTYILITKATLDKISDKFITRFLDKVSVRGKSTSVDIFELVEEIGHVSNNEIKFIKLFENSVAQYLNREWDKAISGFSMAMDLKDDKACKIYIDRCSAFKVTPPDSLWNGVYNWEALKAPQV